MFDLAFIKGRETDPSGFFRGRITLGAFREEFLASAHTWDTADYDRQWLAAARRLIAGAPRDGFVTSFVDPPGLNNWWPAWREANVVYLHNALTGLAASVGPFDPTEPGRSTGDREVRTDDDTPISEWQVTIEDLVEFVHRRGSSSPVAA